ncbi:MAG: hypothetical protein Q4C50_02790 [Eubacteriales bacterium]|nr:hypothetical protein [Eubacteriales bacterium]
MSRVENDNLYLSDDETRNLISALLNPNRDNLAKRDAFISSMKNVCIEYRENGTVRLEVPELVLEDKQSLRDCLPELDKKGSLCYGEKIDSICVRYEKEMHRMQKNTVSDEKYYAGKHNYDLDQYYEVRMTKPAA